MPLRLAGFALVLAGISLAAYGAFGTFVVFGDWLSCGSLASAALASLPDCRTIPWPRQFGIGGALMIVGAIGVSAGFGLCAGLARHMTLADAD